MRPVFTEHRDPAKYDMPVEGVAVDLGPVAA